MWVTISSKRSHFQTKVVEIKEKHVFVKVPNSRMKCKEGWGLCPSPFYTFKTGNLSYYKYIFFFDFDKVCLKMTEIWWNRKPHDFEDLWKFYLSWVKWCSLKGLKGEICWFKIQIWSTFSDIIEFLHTRQNLSKQEISAIGSEILLCAFIVLPEGEKLRSWDARNGVGKFKFCTF